MPSLPLSKNNERIDVVLRKCDVAVLECLADARDSDVKDYIRQVLESHVAEYRAMLYPESHKPAKLPFS